jgi:hypothetical protein
MEDYCSWKTEGTPSLEINCKKPDTVGVTCATAVNRISSVIDARAGYVTISELGPLAWKLSFKMCQLICLKT